MVVRSAGAGRWAGRECEQASARGSARGSARQRLRIGTWLAAVAVCGAAVAAWPGPAAAAGSAGTASGTASAAAASGAAPHGGWTWPLAGPPPVTRGFAPPQVRYGAGHRGVDLGGGPGTPVLAAGAGEVSWAGVLAGRGVVVVQHGELRTTYEPVTAQVSVGQRVATGEPLGTLEAGHAGCPVAACLHWGLKRGQEYLDPLSLVGAGPVRLLPVLAVGGPAAVPGSAPAPRQVALPPPPPPPAEPALDLRSAVTPSGALALTALLLGLALLVRPRPPRRPAGGAALDLPQDGDGAAPWEQPPGHGWGPQDEVPDAVPRPDGDDGDDREPAPVLDLGRERARRAGG